MASQIGHPLKSPVVGNVELFISLHAEFIFGHSKSSLGARRVQMESETSLTQKNFSCTAPKRRLTVFDWQGVENSRMLKQLQSVSKIHTVCKLKA